MTIEQTRKILLKIAQIEEDIDRLKEAMISLGTSEYVSCTLASGGGSKSYTKADVSKISTIIVQLSKELSAYQRMISGQRKDTIHETIFLQGI